MDNLEYAKLPQAFRTAFEEKNGGLPFGEFVGRVWLNMAETWYQGWQLAMEHGVTQPAAPASPRYFMVSLYGDGVHVHETSMLGGPVSTKGFDTPRSYSSGGPARAEGEITCSTIKGQVEPAPMPVPPPMPMHVPRQGRASAAPVTAAEAAAASAKDSEDSEHKAFILPVDPSDDRAGYLVIAVEPDYFRNIGWHLIIEEARDHAKRAGYQVVGYSYFITDEQIKYWRRHPQTKGLDRSFHPSVIS